MASNRRDGAPPGGFGEGGGHDEARRFLDAIIENIPDMVFVKDAEALRFVRFNRAGEELLGIPREAMYGKSDHDFFPPDEAAFFIAKDREVLARGAVVDIPVEPIRTAKKGLRYLHTKKVPIHDEDGRPIYLLGISEDITDRHRAGEERQRLLDLIEQAPDFVGLFAADGTAEYVNAVGRDMLGLDGDAAGRVRFADCHPPRLADFVDAVVLAQARSHGTWRGELPWRHDGRPGGEVVTLAVVQAQRTASGELRGFSIIARDITPEKEAHRVLAAESATLRAANARLAEADRVKSEFVANVSHELRTPLTLILAPLESLLTGEVGALTGAQTTALRMVHDNGVRLLHLIGGLLDLSRLEAGHLEVHREPTDVAALVRRVVADFEPLLARDRLALDLDVADAAVDIDRHLFERILFNLLSNAIKFTPAGGRVAVALRTRGDRLVLRVTDTGVGIEPAQIPSLFRRFRQLEGSSTRRHEGTGLGLALVKELSTLLGGGVTVTSEPGRGAAFTVELQAPPASGRPEPIVRVHPAVGLSPDVAAVPGTAAASAHKVLIAEDNPDMAAYIATVLRDVAATRHARDGVEALEAARAWRPDLVIADVMMPRRDGIELCRLVKSDPVLLGTPVVLLSALTQRDALLRGWEAGADEYLFKPFHPEELRTRIARMLAALDKDHLIRRLKQANDELGQFARLASHDLKGPIRTIASYADLLGMECGDALDEECQGYLQRISAAAGRLAEVVDDTLRLTELGQRGLELAEVDLDDVLRAALDLVGGQLEEAGAVVTVDPLPRIRCDRSLLGRVFQNLLDNALKFRRHDVRPEIRVAARRGEAAWILSVKDNGVGVDPGVLADIFEPFVRLRGRDERPGHGMGLALVRKIVELHGGRVWVDSTPGAGSTFFFTVPDPRG